MIYARKELSEALGLNVDQVHYLILSYNNNHGPIPRQKIGGRWVYDDTALALLRAWLETRKDKNMLEVYENSRYQRSRFNGVKIDFVRGEFRISGNYMDLLGGPTCAKVGYDPDTCEIYIIVAQNGEAGSRRIAHAGRSNVGVFRNKSALIHFGLVEKETGVYKPRLDESGQKKCLIIKI